VVVAVAVDNRGTDLHTMVPLCDQVEERFGENPEEWLADGGCSSLDNIDAMSERGCAVFSPLRQRRTGRNPSEIRPGDSEAVQQWRRRMTTEAAKTIYKQRGATAEWINARCRAQGLAQFIVRGAKQALSVVLLHAITNNMSRARALAC
jgi:hypothetical protein